MKIQREYDTEGSVLTHECIPRNNKIKIGQLAHYYCHISKNVFFFFKLCSFSTFNGNECYQHSIVTTMSFKKKKKKETREKVAVNSRFL